MSMANTDADRPECGGAPSLVRRKTGPLRWSNILALILGIIVIPAVLVALFAHGFTSEMLRPAKRRLGDRRR